jgi:SOS response associated peptidase (SRAP)
MWVIEDHRAGSGSQTCPVKGLVPSWAKDPATGSKLINARVETLADKPAWRHAIRKRRVILRVSGYRRSRPRDSHPVGPAAPRHDHRCRRTPPLEEEYVRQRYRVERWPVTAIARELNAGLHQLLAAMDAAGIPRRARPERSASHPRTNARRPTRVTAVRPVANGPGCDSVWVVS